MMDYELLSNIAWVLLNFIWQGCVIAFAAFVALICVGRHNANARYYIGLLSLLLMVLAPLSTWVWMFSEPTDSVDFVHSSAATLMTGFSEQVVNENITFVSYHTYLPLLTLLWLLGVAYLSFKHMLSAYALYMIKRSKLQQVSVRISNMCGNLAWVLGINRFVQIYRTERVTVPCVIGIWKPIILLPLCGLSGLSTTQVELIIAHELAHIKRHDYLVNILQSWVEVLLFFHPAVHWVSRIIRHERENCCDETALKHVNQPLEYARALLLLADEDLKATGLSVSAKDGDFKARIKRLLAVKHKPSSIEHFVGLILLLVPAISVFAFSMNLNESTEPLQNEVEKQLIDSQLSQSLDKIEPAKPELVSTEPKSEGLNVEVLDLAADQQKASELIAVRTKLFDKSRSAVRERIISKPKILQPQKDLSDLNKAKTPDFSTISNDVKRNDAKTQVKIASGDKIKHAKQEAETTALPVLTPKVALKLPVPKRIKRKFVEGYVIVNYQVTAQGRVKDVEVVESQPRGLYDRSVIKGIKKLVYEPYKSKHYSVVPVTQRIEFNQKVVGEGEADQSTKQKRVCITGSRICRPKGNIPTRTIMTIQADGFAKSGWYSG